MAYPRFAHIGVVCRDPKRLEKFYTKHFGFRRARVYAPGLDQVVMIKLGEVYLELFKASEPAPAPPPKAAGHRLPIMESSRRV